MLERLPNGCYPNSAFREQLIGLLRGLPVSQEHLSRTRIGVVLVDLERSGEEMKATLQKIADIKQRWSRIVCNLTMHYRDLTPEHTTQGTGVPRRDELKGASGSLENKEEPDMLSLRRSRVYHDFSEKPKFVKDRLSSSQAAVR